MFDHLGSLNKTLFLGSVFDQHHFYLENLNGTRGLFYNVCFGSIREKHALFKRYSTIVSLGEKSSILGNKHLFAVYD